MTDLQSTAFVVFGATSNLAKTKLYPALYGLAQGGLLPDPFYLFGVAQEEMSDAQWRTVIRESIEAEQAESVDAKAFERLVQHLKYVATDVKQSTDFQAIETTIKEYERENDQAIQRLFYLALPPALFPDVAKQVEACRMGKDLCSKEQVLSRILIEKPFGYDGASAKRLDEVLHQTFKEEQIYRIDHYLGKEPFQNILVFRFGNQLFENQWNNEYVSHIQVNALESANAEGRGAYYEGTGALRDMVQSHLLQFLAYLTMDEPKEMTADALHTAKERILMHVRPFGNEPDMVCGQYKGYREHKDVADDSETETAVALTLEINTPRWRGVPIYVRTGKQLARKDTSAVVTFKERTGCFLAPDRRPLVSNLARLDVAPHPGVSMRVNMHAPGTQFGALPAPMHFCRSADASATVMADYEKILLAAMKGDRLLFASSKEVLHAWAALAPFLRRLETTDVEIYNVAVEQPAVFERIVSANEHAWVSPIVDCDRHT